MSFFTETEKQFKQAILSYDTCKDIYRTSVMGKRIVEALVNFSMSAERELSIQKAPPEAVDQFKLVAKQLKQKEAIKRTIYNARIYGTGALYVALHNMITDKDDFDTKPNFNNAEDFDICFNVLDPQNISGSVVDNNPLSFTFLQLINIKVDNQLVPRKRIAISHAVEPLYLDQRTSLISYSPPSVFYNMVDLLKDYDAAIEALDNLLYKAGAIIYKYPNQKFSGITLDVIKKSAEILEQKQNGNVIAISDKCTIEDFPINNVNGLIESVNKLEDAITKALNDTPASLLFDKSLSNGFSEGDKDKETEISIIEAFRENKLAPLYNLTDYYVMLKAFDNNFINEMKDKYNDFKDKTNAQIFYDWVNSFKYEFGNLFPEPESITIDNNTKKLDNLLKLKELGANLSDIEAELNEDEIFKQEIDLDGQAPTFTEGEQSLDEEDDLENEDLENNKIDTNMYRFIDNGNDNKTDDKKDFDEDKIKRDKDGKFAKKNESGDGKKDNDKKAEPKDEKLEEFKARLKEARRIKRYLTNKMNTETMSAVQKDRYKETLRRTENEINEIKEERDKYLNPDKYKDKQKDNTKATKEEEDKSGLDYGDLPTELHAPFRRLNTTTKPSELIFNNNEYGLTIDDVKDIDADVFCNIICFKINDDGLEKEVDLTNRDNLQSPVEKFLYDFTGNSDNAKHEWGEQWEHEIKPQLQQMIKNSPTMKGKAYRVETFHPNREEIVEGGKINFDCRSVSDDNKGYETVCNFSQDEYYAGDDIIIFEFPEDTRGLNIQGASVYPNQHEYLVDGDFIMETVEKDELNRTVVRLKKAE